MNDETETDAEVEAVAADETPVATTQKDHLDAVIAQTDDERHGLWGQPIN